MKSYPADYFRSFRTYEEIPDDTFAKNMMLKYKDNIVAHYDDQEYVDAGRLFYEYTGKKVAAVMRRILAGKLDDFLSKRERNIFQRPRGVVDVGAGIGLLTLDLKKMYRKVPVRYTNLRSKQWDHAKVLFDNNGVKIDMFDMLREVPRSDIMFVIDYFEHFQNIEFEVRKTINIIKPVIIVDRTDPQHAFVGHHMYYRIDGQFVHYKKCYASYRKLLASLGYHLHPISSKCWNGVPKFYFHRRTNENHGEKAKRIR